MAIIKEMLGKKQIDGFKGKLDFYYYMGLPIARRWPRSQGNSQTPASVAQIPKFIYCSQLFRQVSPFVYQTYIDIAAKSGLHGKDWFTRAYYGKMYHYPT